jgi:hypothetical protein
MAITHVFSAWKNDDVGSILQRMESVDDMIHISYEEDCSDPIPMSGKLFLGHDYAVVGCMLHVVVDDQGHVIEFGSRLEEDRSFLYCIPSVLKEVFKTETVNPNGSWSYHV